MPLHNANNERIKRQYFAYLKEAKRYSEPTVDAVAKALSRFEGDTKFRDFKAFHIELAITFKRRLAAQQSVTTGESLSKATLNATLAHLKRFFQWLAGQPGYKSRISYSDAEYFNLSEKDTRVATTRREQPFPTLAQVLHVLSSMPVSNEIVRRNRAVIAFTLLTAARDSATASMKLKDVDLINGTVYQDARHVKTKFSKSFTTFFFPVGDVPLSIVSDWIAYLRDRRQWGNNDPLFPATKMELNADRQFVASGLSREHWKTASPIRGIFSDAFQNAGLPYFNPHSIRKTIVQFGETICQNAEELKAWSQNMGHDGVLTTLLNYGVVATSRQGEIMKSLSRPRAIDIPAALTAATNLLHQIEKHTAR